LPGSYQEKSSAEIENQGPATGVTLKQGDTMDWKFLLISIQLTSIWLVGLGILFELRKKQ